MPLTYDPEFAAAFGPLASKLASLPKPAKHDIDGRRQLLANLFSGPPVPIPASVTHTTHTIRSCPPLTLHRFFPTAWQTSPPPRSPALLHTHGGGYFAMTVTQAASSIAAYVAASGVQILSVDYRLAPEDAFPAALDDAFAALQHLHAHAGTFDLDLSRLAVFGESAGGGLAAALAIRARDEALSPPLSRQVLVYPMLDFRTVTSGGSLAFWSGEDNETGWAAYLGRERYEKGLKDGQVEAWASPSCVESVEGLPPLYIECPQLDIFCVEDVAYAKRFLEAGIETELHVVPGLPHGFEALGAGTKAAERAMEQRVRVMKSL
ncbi:Hormone-sensitive lipase [Sphaceloma murrayae]|uniref:Hormone-sensitive lipase n=1 Tax=Sphaceloma murrayae TaxID=2082308 RepID=A0A2K1QN06_9PEZI|nr:Hormone-sensitive lipase [Sphaceloma murrayae]